MQDGVWVLVYPLILFGHICTLIDFMADVKPIFSIFYFITLTNVFIKVTLADLITTSAIKSIKVHICPNKIKGYTNTHTPSCIGN